MTVEFDLSIFPDAFLKFLRRIYSKPMSVVVIKGVPKSGKTDFMLKLFEILRSMGLIKNFASNAECRGCSWISYIDNLMGLKTWGYGNRESKLFGYDEVIESATNRRAMSDLNVGWVQYLPQVSKAHMHILALVQEEEGGKRFYESVFLDPVFLRGMWYKEKRDVAVFKSKFYDVEGYRLRDIPKTGVPFDKDVPAHFTLNQTANILDIKMLPRTMQVALLYRNDDVGYDEVKRQTGLTENKQVQREIKKALRILLMSDEGRKRLEVVKDEVLKDGDKVTTV